MELTSGLVRGPHSLAPIRSPGIRARRGRRVPQDASISVVAMAVHGDPQVADAVKSLLEQDVPVEVIVVNSGRGLLPGTLDDRLLERLVLVEADDPRMPGGTRNLGIAEARAPIVAFLAADCLVAPDWARLRVEAHLAGATAVASALRPSPAGNGRIPLSSWASYALLHVRRAPEYPAQWAKCYGVSYDRAVFERHGLFRDDLRIGEDTEFNARIATDGPILWAPHIVTLHRYPQTVGAAIRDMFRRGAELHRYNLAHRRWPLLASIGQVLESWRVAHRLVRLAEGQTRAALMGATPLIALLALAYAGGGVVAALRLDGRRP